MSYRKNENKFKIISLNVNSRIKLDKAGIIWKKTQEKFTDPLGLNNKNELNAFTNKISKIIF